MDFIKFKRAVSMKFAEMQKHPMYRTKATKDGLWATYLASFPEGTNPLFRERTEHDCQCCKQFIGAVGNVVAIINGQLHSIWDTPIAGEPEYSAVSETMALYVKAHEIDNVFTHFESKAGMDKNFADLIDGKTQEFQHFFVNVDSKFVKADPGSFLADRSSTFQVFKRSLLEIKGDAIETVMELINQNCLYRGEENAFAVGEFNVLSILFEKEKPGLDQDLFVWSKIDSVPQSITRIRNTSIGTLLVDLSEGKDLEYAVKSFEAKVAPTNYKRPTALVTKAMIDKAKVTVEELGLTSALERRYAQLTDITVNNVLFADRSTRKAMGDVFDDLSSSIKDPVGNLDKIEDVSIDKFISDILPSAKSIEIMVRNENISNLMSLIAPVNPTANPLFKWSNSFSWSYNGDLADSIKDRVKQAGGNVTGELCCRLAWDYADDLDFYMREPDGHFVYFSNRRQLSRCGGMLDVDANGIDGVRENPVENIFYDKIHKMKIGTYNLYVKNYNRRSPGKGFEVEIDVLGSVSRLEFDKVVPTSGHVDVATITLSKDSVLDIATTLPSSQSIKTVWGIKTNKFQKVNAIMLSPNHWDDNGVGNKHFFFMLEGCVNEGTARGFYNEFLKADLDQHRKVLEMVGAKLRTDESEHQLSGVGFSSTQRNSVVCRVSGNFSRIINIKF